MHVCDHFSSYLGRYTLLSVAIRFVWCLLKTLGEILSAGILAYYSVSVPKCCVVFTCGTVCCCGPVDNMVFLAKRCIHWVEGGLSKLWVKAFGGNRRM